MNSSAATLKQIQYSSLFILSFDNQTKQQLLSLMQKIRMLLFCVHMLHIKLKEFLVWKEKKCFRLQEIVHCRYGKYYCSTTHSYWGRRCVRFLRMWEKSCSWICCWEHWGTWFVEIGWIGHCQIHISWSKLPDFIQSTSFKMESIEIQVNTKAATRQGLSWTPYPESKLSSVHTTELRQTRCTTFANWKWMVSWKWNM